MSGGSRAGELQFCGKNSMVLVVLMLMVLGMWQVKFLQWSGACVMKNPSVPLSAHEPLFIGLSCTNTLQARGVAMQLKWPLSMVCADSGGLSLDGLSMFRVSSVCWSSRSQSLDGKVLSAMHLMEMKCDFTSWMDLSAGSYR